MTLCAVSLLELCIWVYVSVVGGMFELYIYLCVRFDYVYLVCKPLGLSICLGLVCVALISM